MNEQVEAKRKKLHERQYEKVDLFIRQDEKETKKSQDKMDKKNKEIQDERSR